MKVLQIVPEFPPPLLAGGGYHVYHLTKELSKRGIDVTVFTLKTKKPPMFGKVDTEIHFNSVKVVRVPAFHLSAISPIAYPIATKLLPLLLAENPDIIHAHGYPFVTSDAALITAKIKRIPMVLTLHGFPDGFNALMHRAYFRLIGRQTLTKARRIIAVSPLVAREFRQIGIPEERMVIIPNGVEIAAYQNLPQKDILRRRLRIKDERKIMLAIGRLGKLKGFQCIIEALPKILETTPVDLIIAGPEFGYGPQLRRLAREKGVDDYVIFYGIMNEKEKLEAMAAADVVVVSSIYEGFGIVLLEALAAGKPVVATETGIAPEIIKNGENGFLFSPCDHQGLADKVTRLLADKELSAAISLRSKTVAETFDWKRITELVLDTYNQCLTESPSQVE